MPASKTITTCLGLFLLSAAVLAASGDAAYRVSGIIMGESKKLVVMEKSDSTQHLHREGDMVDAFTIVRIETDGVTLQRDGAFFYMELEGKPSRLNDLPAMTVIREVRTDDGHATRGINFAAARAEMDALSRTGSAVAPDARVSRSGGAPPTGGGSSSDRNGRSSESSGTDAEDKKAVELTFAERLNVALGLPSYAVIHSVNKQPVSGPQQALLAMQEPIKNGWTARLEVSGVPGVDVIYVKDKELPPSGPQP